MNKLHPYPTQTQQPMLPMLYQAPVQLNKLHPRRRKRSCDATNAFVKVHKKKIETENKIIF
jgi:hypothetical protein